MRLHLLNVLDYLSLALVLILLGGVAVYAVPGEPDLSFNGSGKQIVGFGKGNDRINATALQTDGKIIAVGGTRFGSAGSAVITRFNADGSLDASFGTNGKVFVLQGEEATATVIQPDGKIVVAAYARVGYYRDFLVIRLNGNGSLDATFAGGGFTFTDFSHYEDIPYAVALQPDGKIVVGGVTEFTHLPSIDGFGLARYNSDGSLDPTFGSQGVVTTPEGVTTTVYSLIVQSDGKIIAAGSNYNNDITYAAVFRYNTDGSLDSSFGNSGKVLKQGGAIYAAALQADGKIVGAGNTLTGGINSIALYRFNTNGTSDESFGSDGQITTSSNGGSHLETARSVLLTSAGKIIAVGGATNDHFFTAVRFDAQGSLDASFGNGGVVSVSVAPYSGDDSLALSAVLQPDGKLIAAGYGKPTDLTSDFALVRLNSDGSLDSGFGTGGESLTDIGEASVTTTGVAAQTDNKIVTVGSAFDGNIYHIALVRHNADGTLDNTFGINGKVIAYNYAATTDYANAVVIQPDGKIIIAGSYGSSSGGFLLMRFNTDGTMDTTFNGSGKVITIFDTYGAIPTSLALDAAGKIVAAGYVNPNSSQRDFAVARYNADGSLDTSLNGSGKVIVDVSGETDTAYSGLIQPDGKIILIGQSSLNYQPYYSIVRLNNNGILDNSFGSGGKVITQFTGAIFAGGLQTDGRIIIGGYFRSANNSDFALLRFNPDGTPDASFGSNGMVTTDVGIDDRINALKIQSDSKIVAAGYTTVNGKTDFATLFYKANGELETDWNAGGISITDFYGAADKAQAITQDSVGRIIVAGSANGLAGIARFTTTLSNRKTVFDFDGDGKSDISVFRPSTGIWYLQQSNNGFTGAAFGQSGDRIVPADYDGDGKTDLAVFRSGIWYLQRSSLGFTGIGFGLADDVPVPADYDGDGKADLAVFRPSNGTWYVQGSTAGFYGVSFGQSGDRPLPADYDGDGKADLAVFRSGTWYLLRSQLGFTGFSFGLADDLATPADYDGDGKADVAVFRPSTGVWYLQQSTAGFAGIAFGQSGDLPTPADYDGDGKADIAVFRSGIWYLNQTTAGFTGVSFGVSTDQPIENAFVK